MSETYTLLHFTLNLQNNWYILIYSINWYCYFSDSDFHKFDQHFRNWVTMVYIFLHLHVSSVLFSYCWRSLNYNLLLSNEMNKLTATFYLCYNWLKLKTICCGKKNMFIKDLIAFKLQPFHPKWGLRFKWIFNWIFM